jgi:hypothetical protein
MKNSLLRLEELNTIAQNEGLAFESGNKSAGARLRKALLEMKALSLQMRGEVSAIINTAKTV